MPGIFDTTHQTCLTADLDLTGDKHKPVAQKDGALLIVVDTANFDTYISHKDKWYGPLPV